MTNKQTIDGVSRETIQRIADHCKFWVDHPYLEAIADVEEELRALLDKPTGSVVDLDAVDWNSVKEAASESKWMPPEYMRNEWVSDICEFLRTGPAVQPQGEVERLREEIERRRIRGQNCSNKVSTLRAQLAERDALLRDIKLYGTSCVTMGAPSISERIDAALSTSAEPKPRGKAVAWSVTGSDAMTLTPQYPTWADGDRFLTITPLYSHPPEPVAVVRRAFICKGCEGVYADEAVSHCDCMREPEFIEGEIRC